MKAQPKAIAATTITKSPIIKLDFYRNADRRGNVRINADGSISTLTDSFAQRESDAEWRS